MRHFALALAGLALCSAAQPAEAALKLYKVYTVDITTGPALAQSPENNLTERPGLPDNVAIVDTNGPAPVLRKFLYRPDYSVTTIIPGLLVSIFISNKYVEGPEATLLIGRNGVPSLAFTGTGSTANGATLRWGSVTGWSITGTSWCNANPSVVCNLAMLMDNDSADPRFNSAFYDLGTWSFHGTGFTAIPFVHSYSASSFGNNQRWVRGGVRPGFSVPALPLLGIAALGSSFAIGGLLLVRRSRS